MLAPLGLFLFYTNMKVIFETVICNDEFQVFKRKDGNITFASLKEDKDDEFCFVMNKEEAKNLAEYLLQLVRDEF